MKHFKIFNDINSYNVFKQSERYIKPNISLINNNYSIYYDPLEDEVIEDPLKDYNKVWYVGSTSNSNNNGNQYIDLGCNLIENSDDIRIQFGIYDTITGSGDCEILSCLKDGDNNHGIRLRVHSSKMQVNTKFDFDERTEYDKDYNSYSYYINNLGTLGYETKYDISIHCSDLSTFNASNDFTTLLFVGMSNNNDTLQRYSICKYTYLKIYKGGQLIRDLVPVTRKSDDKPGLFDLVNKVFYINNGSNELTVGPKCYNHIFELPNSYSKIDYVESVGQSYIKIPECINLKTGDNIKFDYLVYIDKPFANSDAGNEYKQASLFNIGYSGQPDGICLHYNDGKPQFKFPNATKSNFTPQSNINYSITNTKILFNVNETNSNVNKLWGLTLFGRSDSSLSGTVDRYILGRIYYLYVYINDELMLGLDPVKDNSGNIGLYDIVNKQFYTSMSETSFITSD